MKAAIKCEKKSPITGGEMRLMQEKSSVKFRGEDVTYIKKYYHCVDSGQDFTDTELDNDNMWAIFRAYWERRGFEHFYDIDGYREEQEPASEDLEQVAREYTEKGSQCQEEMDAFIAGAQWDRAQMMKDAISGFVVEMLNIDGGVAHKYVETDFLPAKEYEKGQEVKVIIIKE